MIFFLLHSDFFLTTMCFSEYYKNHRLFPNDLHRKLWNYLELFLTFFLLDLS